MLNINIIIALRKIAIMLSGRFSFTARGYYATNRVEFGSLYEPYTS